MKIKATKGHLTATEKRAICAILGHGLTSGKLGRKSYFITQEPGGAEYSVKIIEMDRGLGLIGSQLRQSAYNYRFIVY